MKSRLAVAACVAAALFSPSVSRSQSGPPKTVALISVYGSDKFNGGGLSQSWSFKPYLNDIEALLVEALHQKGMRVLPLAATASEFAAAWDATYFKNMEPNDQRLLTGQGQTFDELARMWRREDKNENSDLTFRPKDYMRGVVQQQGVYVHYDFENANYRRGAVANEAVKRDSVFTNTLAFRKTVGELAKKVGADAAIIVRALPGQEAGKLVERQAGWFEDNVDGKAYDKKEGTFYGVRIDAVMLSSSGEQLFRGSAIGLSKDNIPTMQILRMKWDSAGAAERLQQAQISSLAQVIRRLPQAGPAITVAADVRAPGVVQAGGPAGEVVKPVTMAEVAGTWELVTVNGQPLPFNREFDKTIVNGTTFIFTAEGKYQGKWDMLMSEKGEVKPKTSEAKGDFKLDGSELVLQPGGFIQKMVFAIVGNPPMQISDDRTTAKAVHQGATYVYKKK